MARFTNSLAYKEITSKSDTELAIIAFRNRVAENCNAEVTSEDAVKGEAFKRIGGVIRTSSACGELHTRRTPRRLPDFAVVGG